MTDPNHDASVCGSDGVGCSREDCAWPDQPCHVSGEIEKLAQQLSTRWSKKEGRTCNDG